MADMPADNTQTALQPIVLSNGSLKNPRTGQFLPGVRPSTALDPARSQELVERRRVLAAERRERDEMRRMLAARASRDALVRVVAEEVGQHITTASAAVGEIAAEFARSALANAMDKPRDATSAAKLALESGSATIVAQLQHGCNSTLVPGAGERMAGVTMAAGDDAMWTMGWGGVVPRGLLLCFCCCWVPPALN